RAFPGKSVPEILAGVLRDEPDWSVVPGETPSVVLTLLHRCLRKPPHDRLQDIGDARLELAELASGRTTDAVASPEIARRSKVPPLPWPALAAAGLLGAGTAVTVIRPRQDTPRALRLSVDLPQSVTLVNDFAAPFAVSPEGTRIVLVGQEGGVSRLFVRSL